MSVGKIGCVPAQSDYGGEASEPPFQSRSDLYSSVIDHSKKSPSAYQRYCKMVFFFLFYSFLFLTGIACEYVRRPLFFLEDCYILLAAK